MVNDFKNEASQEFYMLKFASGSRELSSASMYNRLFASFFKEQDFDMAIRKEEAFQTLWLDKIKKTKLRNLFY